MKFLIDAQLPPALAQAFKDAGHEATYVAEIGMEQSRDSSIWSHAISSNAAIVTKDEDFAARIPMDR